MRHISYGTPALLGNLSFGLRLESPIKSETHPEHILTQFGKTLQQGQELPDGSAGMKKFGFGYRPFFRTYILEVGRNVANGKRLLILPADNIVKRQCFDWQIPKDINNGSPRNPQNSGDLIGCRFALIDGYEFRDCSHNLVPISFCVHRYFDSPLFTDGYGDLGVYPPNSIGIKSVSFKFEFVRGSQEADISFLDKVQKIKTSASPVELGDIHDFREKMNN
jgi:hypothetical protein